MAKKSLLDAAFSPSSPSIIMRRPGVVVEYPYLCSTTFSACGRETQHFWLVRYLNRLCSRRSRHRRLMQKTSYRFVMALVDADDPASLLLESSTRTGAPQQQDLIHPFSLGATGSRVGERGERCIVFGSVKNLRVWSLL